MSDIADNFLLDLGFLLREKAFAVKAELHAGKDPQKNEFLAGKCMAYYEVISLMLNQAEAFNLTPDRLALAGVDAERDLGGQGGEQPIFQADATGPAQPKAPDAKC